MQGDYQSFSELIEHIDQEGGTQYFFCNYTDAKTITVRGVPLPAEVLAAVSALEASSKFLDGYFS